MILAIEEGELAQWILGILRAEVDELQIVDPRENRWIARATDKNDTVDALKLARLLAGQYVKPVYHAVDTGRVEFKRAVQSYQILTRQVAAMKCRIKARERAQGRMLGEEAGRKRLDQETILKEAGNSVEGRIAGHQMTALKALEKAQQSARALMCQLGRRYPEVKRFQDVPGIGPVGACTFSAFVQTPARFPNKRAIWRYAGFGITDRSSDGKPLGFKRLDRNGVSSLKTVSYMTFCTCMRGDNEFSRFYAASLRRTLNKTHARLNTQRKILAVLYGMWKRNEPYIPEEKRKEQQPRMKQQRA
jgi:transposase